ncbi:hypothetical protein, partial [Escherichia coli]|uniref:hypothetical protein n=1 Tax=Escherichia coli TaxID=562 RepID=UPI0030C73DB0
WSTSKTPSYTKSVSWQHHPGILPYLHHTFFVSGSFFDTIFATCSLALTVNVFLNLPPSSFVREK